MKKFIVFLLGSFLMAQLIFAQGTAGSDAKYEYRSLIDIPSAGILEKGFVGIALDAMPYGVLISKIEVGAFENFSFGISYGGSNIIGTGKINWYPLPGVNARFRIIDETEAVPAISVGFDSQGKGEYFDSLKRFEIKSPGFFVAAAKNFQFLGYLSLHGMINYTLERKDDDKDINFGFGFEKTIGSRLSFLMEYDFALNDNGTTSLGDGKGYLNMGFRLSVGDGMTLGLDFRNLLNNKKFNTNSADRAFFIEYIKGIF